MQYFVFWKYHYGGWKYSSKRCKRKPVCEKDRNIGQDIS